MTEKELLHKRERKAQRRRARGYEIVETRRGPKRRKKVLTAQEIEAKERKYDKQMEQGEKLLRELYERLK